MNNILSPELVTKLNEKLSGLLDLVNTTNAEELFRLIVKYNTTAHLSTLVLCIAFIVLCIIAIIISVIRLDSDDCRSEGLYIGIIIVSVIVIFVALLVGADAGYSLFMWSTNPEISVIKWLR